MWCTCAGLQPEVAAKRRIPNLSWEHKNETMPPIASYQTHCEGTIVSMYAYFFMCFVSFLCRASCHCTAANAKCQNQDIAGYSLYVTVSPSMFSSYERNIPVYVCSSQLLAAAAPMQPTERTPESGGSACDRAIALAEVLPRRSEEQLIAAVNCPLAHFWVFVTKRLAV